MEMQRLYADISERTGGSIYIGVIGPVRTGKSTFIKRFMQAFVVPNIENEHQRARALDELPQSGAGRTVMTAEPKFIPEEAVAVCFGESSAKIRMVDCVGYMVPGALGQFENEMPRMVSTPWFDHEIPMTEAAEIGTRKVITEHATVGVIVTTDGSVTDLPREEYAEAEAARTSAETARAEYAQKLSGAQDKVDSMLEEATVNASRRGERIVADAQDKADGIIRQAQTEAEMEKKKAQATIRREITDVSAALAEKLLGREMSANDHKAMIDSFLDGIGDEQ